MVSFKPNQTISKIVQYLKGASGYQIFQEFPEIRKEFWGGHFLQTGYFASTCPSVADEIIQKYIDEDDQPQEKAEISDGEINKVFNQDSI